MSKGARRVRYHTPSIRCFSKLPKIENVKIIFIPIDGLWDTVIIHTVSDFYLFIALLANV